MRREIVFLMLMMISVISPKLAAEEDVKSLVKITSELAEKCREYRKKFDLKTTGKRLAEYAEKYKGLDFNWSDNGTASLLYHGMRGIILPSDCQAPGSAPVDSISK